MRIFTMLQKQTDGIGKLC